MLSCVFMAMWLLAENVVNETCTNQLTFFAHLLQLLKIVNSPRARAPLYLIPLLSSPERTVGYGWYHSITTVGAANVFSDPVPFDCGVLMAHFSFAVFS